MPQQPGPSASLPAVPVSLAGVPAQLQSQIAPLVGIPAQPTAATAASTPAIASDNALEVAEQAKQLVTQYGQDPFKLAGTIGQLKGQYITRHFHVTPSQAGD